jgi:Tfp pilus assembly protein PilE
VEIVVVIVVVAVLAVIQLRRRGSKLQRAEDPRASRDR